METLVRENRNADQRRAEQLVTPLASVVEDTDAYLLKVEMPGDHWPAVFGADRRNIDPPRIAPGEFPARLRARSQHRHFKDLGSDGSGDSDAYASESGGGETPQDHSQLSAREA